jgi:hypothetical protein
MYRKFVVSSLTLLVAACASLQRPTPTVNVPDKLKPPANESLAMIVPAKGVQIYECRAKKDQAGAYEWAFVAPRPISLIQAERRLADTMPVPIGNKPMAERARIQ